ncbi:hypothetical protein SAMN05421858_3871 [Haladaptatus litoreus]|uniref:Uncharacterized protein n=1 Tax=Haladaptatus litoreus TaxID=553468 RepID=A0A1N7DZ66_9EURY|nr:hypothetical protein [Haladaptatus litoreus]SIR81088.1 hypothetical protein SAMN05421858_3871 [Haladaptatus litoreus]
MNGPSTSTGPKKPDDSILNVFKPVVVLVVMILLLFALVYYVG